MWIFSHSSTICWKDYFFSIKKKFSVYLFLRETETKCEWVRGRERGRHRIWSRLQALNCQHRAWRGTWIHKWDHDLSWRWMLNWLSHSGAPRSNFLAPGVEPESVSFSSKENAHGAPGWLSRLSVWLAQVVISWFVGLSPALGSVLIAQSLEPASDSVSPFLSVPPLLMLCLCLKNK